METTKTVTFTLAQLEEIEWVLIGEVDRARKERREDNFKKYRELLKVLRGE